MGITIIKHEDRLGTKHFTSFLGSLDKSFQCIFLFLFEVFHEFSIPYSVLFHDVMCIERVFTTERVSKMKALSLHFRASDGNTG